MIEFSESRPVGKPLQMESQVMVTGGDSPVVTLDAVGSTTSGIYRSDIRASTVGLISQSTTKRVYPRVGKDRKALASLTSALLPLSVPLQAIVISGAAEVGFPLERVEWTAFKYKDQKRIDVVLKAVSSANRQQALAFWEFIGERVDDWITRLPDRQADTLQDRLSFEIAWR